MGYSEVEVWALLSNLLADATVDMGVRRYLGTVLLDASSDARGVFTLRSFEHPGHTLLVDAYYMEIIPASYQRATITFPCTDDNCFDGDRCTIDTCDADGVTCRFDPVLCPPDHRCVMGTCRPFILAQSEND